MRNCEHDRDAFVHGEDQKLRRFQDPSAPRLLWGIRDGFEDESDNGFAGRRASLFRCAIMTRVPSSRTIVISGSGAFAHGSDGHRLRPSRNRQAASTHAED
jgi:hypothetical protein